MTSDLSDLIISDPEVASQEASQVIAQGEGQAQQYFRTLVNSAFAANAEETPEHGLDVASSEPCLAFALSFYARLQGVLICNS